VRSIPLIGFIWLMPLTVMGRATSTGAAMPKDITRFKLE